MNIYFGYRAGKYNFERAMNLFYPVNERSKACWVFDALKQAYPDCNKIENYQWDGDPSAFWGLVGDSFNLIKRHQRQGVPFLFTDMPYWARFMPDRSRDQCYWRTITNALHCNKILDVPGDRFQSLNVAVRDWQTRGSHILVCPSSVTMERFYGEDNWTERTVETLRKYTDRPIRVRPKPRNFVTSGPAAAIIALEDDLKDAHAIVTLASISAVDAVTYGIPSFASKFSPAAPVSELDLSKIEKPRRPDRTAWLNTLAYHQYSEQEIRDGLLQNIIGDMI